MGESRTQGCSWRRFTFAASRGPPDLRGKSRAGLDKKVICGVPVRFAARPTPNLIHRLRRQLPAGTDAAVRAVLRLPREITSRLCSAPGGGTKAAEDLTTLPSNAYEQTNRSTRPAPRHLPQPREQTEAKRRLTRPGSASARHSRPGCQLRGPSFSPPPNLLFSFNLDDSDASCLPSQRYPPAHRK